jgi:hypothetical protein
MGEVRDTLLRRRGEGIAMLKGSQASPTCLSDKSRVKVKTLGWLEAVACDRDRGIWFSELVSNCIIWKE